MVVVTKGFKGRRRVKAQLRNWASFKFVTEACSRFAHQYTICCFTSFEFMSSCFALWIFLNFQEIALNGFVVTRWKVYVTCVSFRLLCSLLGFLAAFRRKIRFMRNYYAALLPNILFSFMATIPLLRTECHCTDFIQCQVLIAFAKQPVPLINPHPPPNRKRWDQRPVPYAEPPSEEMSTRVWRLLPGDSTLISNKTAATRERSLLQQSSAFGGPPDTRPLGSNTAKTPQENPAMIHLHYLEDFVLSSPTIKWVSKWRHCKDFEPNDLDLGSDFKSSLEALLSMKALRTSVFKPKWNDEFVHHLGNGLQHCVQDPRCGVLHLMLLEGMQFKICMLGYPTVPIPAKGASNSADKTMLTMSLQKHHIRAQKEFAKVSTDMIGERLDSKPPELAWTMLRDVHAESCRCDPRFPTLDKPGCQVWKDGPKWRSWCVIEERSLASCLRNSIAVYKHTSAGDEPDYFWSEELCNTRSCKCAGIGLPPSPTNRHVVKEYLVGQYGFNYGRTCKKWDAEDEEPWCYVGFDTTCPDRKRDVLEVTTAAGQTEKLAQYYSAYPCIRDHHYTIMKSYQDRCQGYIAGTIFLTVTLNIVSLPMLIIVFKFLMNRCGDHFALDDQFNVQLSSDEENDDFEIGADEEVEADSREGQPLKSALKKDRSPKAKSDDVQEKIGDEEKSFTAVEEPATEEPTSPTSPTAEILSKIGIPPWSGEKGEAPSL